MRRAAAAALLAAPAAGAGFQYRGCYQDKEADRLLKGLAQFADEEGYTPGWGFTSGPQDTSDRSGMTCINFCSQKAHFNPTTQANVSGFQYAGVLQKGPIADCAIGDVCPVDTSNRCVCGDAPALEDAAANGYPALGTTDCFAPCQDMVTQNGIFGLPPTKLANGSECSPAVAGTCWYDTDKLVTCGHGNSDNRVSVYEIDLCDGIEHQSDDCASECTDPSGVCAFCGTGVCCRKGTTTPGGACDGNIGGTNSHACTCPPAGWVAPPPIVRFHYVNCFQDDVDARLLDGLNEEGGSPDHGWPTLVHGQGSYSSKWGFDDLRVKNREGMACINFCATRSHWNRETNQNVGGYRYAGITQKGKGPAKNDDATIPDDTCATPGKPGTQYTTVTSETTGNVQGRINGMPTPCTSITTNHCFCSDTLDTTRETKTCRATCGDAGQNPSLTTCGNGNMDGRISVYEIDSPPPPVQPWSEPTHNEPWCPTASPEACDGTQFATYCEAVRAHVTLESYEFMAPTCPSVPAASIQEPNSCAVKINGGRPQHKTNCNKFCAKHGATCVDGSVGLKGKTCDDPWTSRGCGGDDELRSICVCRDFFGVAVSTPSPTVSTPSPTWSTTPTCRAIKTIISSRLQGHCNGCSETFCPGSDAGGEGLCAFYVEDPGEMHCDRWCKSHGATCVDGLEDGGGMQGGQCMVNHAAPALGCNTRKTALHCVCAFALTPSPTSSTPSPTSTTPSPISTTPSPTSSTPSPTSSTSAPTSTTPSPTSSTPSPTSSTPSPSSSTPGPTSSTPSPTSSTPAPTTLSVSGDPFTSFGGKKTQFYLPPKEMTQLLACGALELLGRAQNSGVAGDGQQWFDMFQLRLHGKEVLAVGVQNATRLLPSGMIASVPSDKSDNGAEEAEEGVDLEVVQALERLRSAGATADGEKLTTLVVTAQGKQVLLTGTKFVIEEEINVTVVRDNTRTIGTGYVEGVGIESTGISMKMESSTAGKFTNTVDRIKNMHIDINFSKLDNYACLTGMLPEIWGLKPMSSSTAKALILPNRNAEFNF